MTDEQQPELRWAPMEPKPSHAKRKWIITGAIIVALAIIGLLLFFLLPRDETPGGAQNPSPSASSDEAAGPSDEPTTAPVTAPPELDPTIEEFRGRVEVWLDDAGRGLDMVSDSSGQDAISVVETLQEDAQRLSDAQPPASISQQWQDGVSTYAQELVEVKAALASESSTSADVEASRQALQSLKDLAGL